MQLNGDTSMNMYCMLMLTLRLLTQTVDESRGHAPPSPPSPCSRKWEEVLSTNPLSTQSHPWPQGQHGDRWQISVTATKVTPLNCLCGPTGGWGTASVFSFYTRFDLLWLDAVRLNKKVLKLMSPISFIQPFQAKMDTLKRRCNES